jgi:tetratricopeptide (TPR) repeat protein
MLKKSLALTMVPAILLAIPQCYAHQSSASKSINLVMPSGTGRIVIPGQGDLQWQTVNLYDAGTRPVFQLADKRRKIAVSYALFPNKTGSASPEICRDDVLNAAIHGLSPVPGISDVKQIKKASHTPVEGRPLATASFFVASLAGAKVAQQNLFGVFASSDTCAEIHISMTSYAPADESTLTAQLETFTFEPDYVPSPQDYFTLGTIFYTEIKSYESAAFYYQRALDTLPANTSLKTRRLITDQLSMSYGISGQLKQSRAINEAAIKIDPEYPLYYYNLACADGEQHKAADAKLHLQQAFDRKANTLQGEHLPDPSQDDSILKLKNDKDFWAFVRTLK